MATNSRSKQKGQALIESGLIVIVFLAMLISAMDFAQVVFVHQSLVDRVRSGLRWGSTNPYDPGAIKNMIRYNQSTQPDQVSPFLGIADSNITVTQFDAGAPTEGIQVSIVNYPYQFLSPWLAKTFSNDMAVVQTLPTEYRP